MSRSKAERKAELQVVAEEMIEALLEWEEEVEKPTFVAIEKEVMRLRKRMDEAMIEEVLKAQTKAEEGGMPQCETCGGEVEHKGRKGRKIGGWVGEVEVKRGYYYCPKCRTGFFPSGPSAKD